jgi:hypothetical protein
VPSEDASILPTAVEVTDDVVWQRVYNELVLLDTKTSHYYSLDAVGARIWDELLRGPDVNEAKERLLATFDIDEATLQQHLADLIAQLVSANVLRITP